MKYAKHICIKALSHGAIFLSTCNAILLLVDHHSLPIYSYTFVTNLHLLIVELRCKLPGKLHRVTGPLARTFELLINTTMLF